VHVHGVHACVHVCVCVRTCACDVLISSVLID